MNSCVLTIAVPTFNMDWCLNKNLATYCDPRLSGKVEVLCLNNASEDRSKDIILSFAEREPAIFRLVDRDSRGYGSSINDAIRLARGRYFRIVDADDWVGTEELIRLVEKLESCSCDVVLTDYTIVNMQDGACTPVCAGTYDVPYDEVLSSLCMPTKTLPSIHATTYRTELLRENGFQMQDGIFFVDEEYVILPYLHVKTVLYEPFNVYRYQVANPEQSTSPKNRGKYYGHREQVLKRLLKEYDSARKSGCSKESLNYCRERILRGVGDHFTTLLIYVEDRKEGRRLAALWKKYILKEVPDFWLLVWKKEKLLRLFNQLRLSQKMYIKIKKLYLYAESNWKGTER